MPADRDGFACRLRPVRIRGRRAWSTKIAEASPQIEREVERILSPAGRVRRRDGAAGARSDYAAIAEHDAAMHAEMACVKRHDDVEEIVPDGLKTWCFSHNRDHPIPPAGCTDAPEWIAARLALCAAYDRRDEALVVLFTTPPTTLAGAIHCSTTSARMNIQASLATTSGNIRS
jgi:hypothetical protein